MATIRRTFEDPPLVRADQWTARLGARGHRSGANIIDTVDTVKTVVEDLRTNWPVLASRSLTFRTERLGQRDM
jgi:multidrug efflux pump